jgi:membrane protein
VAAQTGAPARGRRRTARTAGRGGLIAALAETAVRWWRSDAPTQCAALAFYTLFSLAPVLLIAVAVASAVFGEEAARAEIERQFRALMGPAGVELVRGVLSQASAPDSRFGASVAGVVALAVGAGAVFNQLQEALNAVWEVEPKPGHWLRRFLTKRLLSFGVVVAFGFLLVVSLLLSAAVGAFGGFLERRYGVGAAPLQLVNAAIFLVLVAGLFLVIYRFLPDARIAWRDVVLGAAVTAAVLGLGKFGIERYLGGDRTASVYGVAGSLVVFLLWVYYSSLIVLLGAGFTRVWSERRGAEAPPEPGARRAAATERGRAPG